MASPGRKRDLVYFVATLIIALVVISAILFVVSPSRSSTTRPGDFALVFKQVRICPSDTAMADEWQIPWAVTLSNGMTAAQPPNDTARAAEASLGYYGTTNSSYSTIVFSVPDGSYSYAITPSGSGGLEPSSGSVIIDGQNATVNTNFVPMSCGSLVSSTTSTAATSSPSEFYTIDLYGFK